MSRPAVPPIGLSLASAAKVVSRAFDDAMTAAGGTMSVWLVLMALKTRRLANQRELADAVGIQGATLTHHLNGMEADGLVTRRRDPDNRRIHLVELTERGETLFHRLAEAAVAFDRNLRTGIGDDQVRILEQVLSQLRHNASTSRTGLDRAEGVG
jgi:MarR family transcriptional regulator for hemolysin